MVLLTALNAKYIHSNLAIYCLKAFVEETYGNDVELAEYTINNSMDHILKKIYKRNPDVVAFSCYIWNIKQVLHLAENLKKVKPEVSIVLGGPEVSYHAKELMEQYSFIDLVMRGEGEETFRQYLDYVIGGTGELCDIAGITYRDESGIYENESRSVMDLNDVVFPYPHVDNLEHRIVYYETSRGCPFSCSYCLSSIDKSVRLRNMDLVRDELDFFLNKKVPQVKFVDRTFNCNHEHAYAIWKYIGEKDNGVTNFHFEIAADLLREEDFKLFESFRPGLIQLEIGVQTTNPQTITAIRRKMNLDRVKQAVARVHALGTIHQHLDLIAGLPYEDYNSFRNSFNEVYAMAPDQLQLGFLKVLKGSYMAEPHEEYQMEYDSVQPYEVLCTKWLPYDDLIRLKGVEELVEVYYNSFQFSASVAFLMNFHDTPFDFFEKLADYYQKHQLFDSGINRFDRYNILQDYFQNVVDDKEHEKLFQDALTFDLFLRDNVKNPPNFVQAWNEKENQCFHEFFDQEAVDHKYLPDYIGYQARQISNMTHLRRFRLDVEELLRSGQIQTKDVYYLFDYKNRNPLNHSARTVRISISDILA